jgi:hypothetical protein
MLRSFPLLGVTLFMYAALDLTVTPDTIPWYDVESVTVRLMSGDLWKISGGHSFIGLSMVLLFVELLRATRHNSASIMNHALSVLVFIGAILMFITVKGYGNSIFFLFTAMTFLDFMAGFIITSASRGREITFGRAED